MNKNKTNSNKKELSQINDVLAYMKSLGKSEITKLDKSEIKVSDWTDYWLTNFCGNLKSNTSVYYHCLTEQHINRVLGNILITALTAEDIQLFINSLSMGVGMEQPLSPKSVKNVHGVLHKCLDAAVKFDYIQKNPATQIILPGIPHRSINVMDNTTLSDFLQRIKGTDKEDVYLFSIFTGMRESEVIGLTWDCIDFDSGSIHIYRQLVQDKVSKQFVFSSLKNNNSRVIYPADFVMELLKRVKETVTETKERFVFVSKTSNTHYTIAALYKTFKRIVKKMGYPNLRFHDLRHTYAVLSLQAGDDIKALQCNLGHFSSAFTLDVYGHYTQEMQRKSAEKMSAFIQDTFPEIADK